MKFGKHPKRNDYRTLKFQTYAGLMPSVPMECDNLKRITTAGSMTTAQLFPMDGNDALGDCTIAAMAHATTVYSGMVGKPLIPAEADVRSLYSQLTGGVDSGMDELTVLTNWAKGGDLGEKILAFAAIEPTTISHVEAAIAIFGGVYLGFQVPDNCMAQFNAGQTWTPALLTHDGHAVFAVAYDQDTVTLLTWGAVQKASWAWWMECVDEAYAIIPEQANIPGFAPGFDLSQLQQDLATIRSV